MHQLLGRSVVALFVLVSLFATTSVASTYPSLPPFVLETVQGDQITDQDLLGPALLFFCMPGYFECEEALALLGHVLADYPEVSGLVVAPIATLALATLEETFGVPWAAIADNRFLFASVFQIREMPTVIPLLDGKAVGRLDPGYSETDLRETLDALTAPETANEETSSDPSVLLGFMKVQAPFLLMFAGAECPYCHAMLPEVHEIASGFDVSLVIVEPLEDPEVFESDAPNLSIALDPDWHFADLFDVRTTPTVFFFDQDGELVWWHEGFAEGIEIVAQALVLRAQEP